MENDEKKNEEHLIQELTNINILISNEMVYKLVHYIPDFDIFLDKLLKWLNAILEVKLDIYVLNESLLVDYLLYERKEWIESMDDIDRTLVNLKQYIKRG